MFLLILLLVLVCVFIIISRSSQAGGRDRDSRDHWITSSRVGANESSPVTRRVSPSIEVKVTTWYGDRVGRTGVRPEWLGYSDSLSVGQWTIGDPLTYVSKQPPEFDEASCIDLTLPLGQPVREPRGALGYWPSYRRMLPDQRANYIQWLASGKRDVLEDIGYVFVYYYGLERRSLVDGKDHMLVVAEILRLDDLYSNSNSFTQYSGSLLAYLVGQNLQNELPRELLNQVIQTTLSSTNQDLLNLVLVHFCQRGEPLPAVWAQKVVSQNDRALRSVVVERLPRQLSTLFAAKYAERSLDQRIVKLSSVIRKIDYFCASRTLGSGYEPFSVPAVTVPDVLGDVAQFDSDVEIWNECIEELKPLSRKLASGHDISSREAYEALPHDLRTMVDHPDKSKWEKIINSHVREDGIALIEISSIAPLIEISAREKLTLKQSKDLAETAQQVGYVIEPDGRILNTAYDWDSLVTLFRDEEGLSKPTSPKYLAACMVLQMGLWVAATDGYADEHELRVLSRFVQDFFDLAPHENRRLEMHKKVLLVRPTEPTRLGKHLQQALSIEQREKLGELLVAIAAATNGVDEREWRALRKVYRSLDIPAERLDDLIKSLTLDHDELVSVRPARPGPPGEPIPARSESGVPIVHLNAGRLREILESTREVAEILANVFAEDTESGIDSLGSRVAPITVPDCYRGLDPHYHMVLMAVSKRENWSSAEFSQLITSLGLTPVDVVEKLNLWSDEVLGDFLIIEDEATVHVQTSLLVS